MSKINMLLLIVSAINFVVTLILIYNLAIFCDVYGVSPSIIYGGSDGLILFWLNVLFSTVILILAIVNVKK